MTRASNKYELDRQQKKAEKLAKLPSMDQYKQLQKMMRTDAQKFKIWWSDYEMKKNRAIKYLRIYNALSEQERWKGGETLLKRVEKWQKKATEALNNQPKEQKAPEGTLETVGDKIK